MGSLRSILDNAATAVIVVVALLTAGLHLADRMRVSRHGPPRLIEEWEEVNLAGIRMGPLDAPVIITQFTDFQCPYCGSLMTRLDSLTLEYPEVISIVTLHFPLSGHPYATRAAIAAECGDRQGAFWAICRVLFENQDSLGTRPWSEFGEDADLSDKAAFEACIALPPDSFPRISLGKRLGTENGVNGTPTVWVNGRVIPTNSLAGLREWTETALKGGTEDD